MIMRMIFNFRLIIIFVLLAQPLSGFSQTSEAPRQNDFEISKNLDIFATLYRQLHVNYVEELSPGELMKTAIDAMLETLDPYTVYIPESDIEDYRFMTTGQYGGIGALIHRRGDWVYISEPYEGFPADKAGLMAGDRIVEVNGKAARGKTVDEISTALKGQPGTEVTIVIQRDTTEKPFEKVITRQEIKVDNVPYYGYVAEGIGYINLSEFRQNAGNDVKDALQKLKASGTLSGLILDLRGNGGGLLNEAVNIVNIFVEKGQLVVSTRGKLKEKSNVHKTLSAPVDTELPLVILVDGSSASASEIVAGAIQDLDRGVIIGQRTFGKGLVQNIVPLSYNAEMKVTIAKYYIPSGRCVQEIEYTRNKLAAEKGRDSVSAAFKTRNGRTVYEGHGIDPDITAGRTDYSNISAALVTKYLLFDYATYFYRTHPQIASAGEFSITDEIYNDFVQFLSGHDYDYTTRSEQALEKLKSDAQKEKYYDAVAAEFEALKNKMMHNKTEDLIKFREEISYLLLLNIIPRYYYQKGRIQASLNNDDEVDEAIKILRDRNAYENILGVRKEGKK
jgi:carboxyl-terminal processing protease